MNNQHQKFKLQNLSTAELGQLNTVITLLPVALITVAIGMSPWAFLGAIPGIAFTVWSNSKKWGVK